MCNTEKIEKFKAELAKIHKYFENKSIDDYEESEKKDVPGYEGLYIATTDGGVWGCKRKKFLRPGLSDKKRGSLEVILSKNGKQTFFTLHRVIALTFIPNPENKPEVNHLDENPMNNHVSNLVWATKKENLDYGSRNKRIGKAHSKAVYCVELDRVFESITAAARETGINAGNLSSCLSGGRKTAGKMHWRFVDESDAEFNRGKQRPVYCVELDKVFETIAQASRETGANRDTIGRCLRGEQQTSGNYHWKYADEVEA